MLGVHIQTVRGWIKTGELRAIDVGGGRRATYRIPASALDEFQAARPGLEVRHD